MLFQEYKLDVKRLIAAFRKVESVKLEGESLLFLSLSLNRLMEAVEKIELEEKETLHLQMMQKEKEVQAMMEAKSANN